MRRLPIYDVSPRHLARAVAAGLSAALAIGLLLHFFVFPSSRYLGLIGLLLLGGAYGYGVAYAVSAATNRKRGTSLAWTTVVVSVVGFMLSRAGVVLIQLLVLPEGLRASRVLMAALNPDFGTLAFLAVAALVAFRMIR
jgi:uncharacterized PurR-regulated membrane protein YhhQ (DUF165 family)